MESDTNSGDYPSKTSSSYAISGKIMLIMIIVLFTIVITMVFLHLYARWYLIQARRRLNLRRRHRSRTATHLVFYVDPNNDTGPGGATANRGLDPSVLKSLPVFVYGYESSKEMTMTMKTIECAVCLSEFEDNETVRCLPKCNHCFHIDCIDMWFHSHSTCPLCRSPVEINETGTESVNDDHVVIAVNETSPAEDVNGSTSGYCSSCRHDEGAGMNRVHSTPSSSSSLFGMRRKRPPWVLPIEVPRRTDDDFVVESPASQSYKSPVGRIRSFRRIMSRGSPSPSGGGGTSWGLSEVDIERGRDDLTPRIRVETPK